MWECGGEFCQKIKNVAFKTNASVLYEAESGGRLYFWNLRSSSISILC